MRVIGAVRSGLMAIEIWAERIAPRLTTGGIAIETAGDELSG
jgi:hypothetical protein